MAEHRGANEEALSAGAVCTRGSSAVTATRTLPQGLSTEDQAVLQQHSPAEGLMGQHNSAESSPQENTGKCMGIWTGPLDWIHTEGWILAWARTGDTESWCQAWTQTQDPPEGWSLAWAWTGDPLGAWARLETRWGLDQDCRHTGPGPETQRGL